MISRAVGLAMALWASFGAWEATAQQMPAWESGAGVPPPPEFGVRDDTNFLGKDSGAKRRISDRLRKLEDARGYRLFLIVEPVLIGTSAPEFAEELRAAWLPKGEGMIIVFEANTRALGIGQDLAAGIDLDKPRTGIPNHEASTVVTKALRDAGDPKHDPAAFIEALTVRIADGIDDYYRRRAAPPPPGRSLRVSLLLVGGVALLTLGGLLAAHFTRRAGFGSAAEFRFPESDRPERLGAPFGGGHIASRSFAGNPRSEPHDP